MHPIRRTDNALKRAIEQIVLNKEQYVRNPKTDFTRNRKFPLKDVINLTDIFNLIAFDTKKKIRGYLFDIIPSNLMTLE